ncbi:TPA: ParB/RepB/Spo0J family partition protein [Streptococcus suis]
MEELHYVPIKDISPNPYQPRLIFDQEKLEELAQSIKENGLIQPLIVRKSTIIGYELLAGERRLRACQLAGLNKVPIIIKKLTDDDLLYQAIIENLQRTDLNPIEEAKSYQKLIRKGLTHEEIAKIIGKSRPYISNCLRLLNLPPYCLQSLEEGKISQGHARLLLSLSAEKQEEWANRIEKEEISVRQLEKLLSKKKIEKKVQKNTRIFLSDQEEQLRKLLGTPVTIQQKKNGHGQIIISYSSIEEYERIINNLK